MKKQSTRRQFLGTGALLLGGTVLGANKLFAGPAIITDLKSKASLINGVQIGLITYSFRDLPDQSAEATLSYIKETGITAIELMGDPAESFAGAPKNPVDFKAAFPLLVKRYRKEEMNDDEKKQLAEIDAKMKEHKAAMNQWRLTAPMNKFSEMKKMYEAAGVKIYAFKPDVFGMDATDAEIEYGMKAAKLLGASHVTLEHPSNDAHTLRLGKLGEKIGMKVGYHGHEQETPTLWDTAINQSKANGLNLDFGHYIAAGNKNPLDILRAKHDHIYSMHTKDRQTPEHGKGNLAWGSGDTPIVEALQLIRDQKYKFPATIELEYQVPQGSTPIAEVKKCLEYCKKALV